MFVQVTKYVLFVKMNTLYVGFSQRCSQCYNPEELRKLAKKYKITRRKNI